MFIKKEIAQSIVDQLKDIIQQDINFITLQGEIIASTDHYRIGDYHEAATVAAKKKKTIIIESDEQYTGSKKGINLLLHYEESIVGVIGITGEVEEIFKYGAIIQKMAEILIIENYNQIFTFSIREKDRYLIEQILHHQENFTSFSSHLNLFKEYKYLRTMIIELDVESQHTIYLFENLLTDLFKDTEIFHFLKNQNLYYIVTSMTHTRKLQNTLQLLFNNVSFLNKELLFIGVGNQGGNIQDLQKSFKESQQALNWSKNISLQDIQFYEELTLGRLLTSVPESTHLEYSEMILKNIPNTEREELKMILYCYGAYNRSISACSKKMHIHKNTFQYQLNKIKTYTSFDPKNIEEYMILKTAYIASDLSKTIISNN